LFTKTWWRPSQCRCSSRTCDLSVWYRDLKLPLIATQSLIGHIMAFIKLTSSTALYQCITQNRALTSIHWILLQQQLEAKWLKHQAVT
jgi:hypothetical protein